MGLGKILKAIEIIFLIAIILSTTNAFALAESKTYFFSATMSPTEVNINQLSTFSVNITNIGTGTLGSLIMYIPSGFTVYPNVTILTPTSSWNYLLSTSSINLTANSMNSAIGSGESLIFIFYAITSSNVGVNTWNTEAKSNAGWVGASLSLNGVQPAVTVDSQLIPPTIFATISTINQGQVSYISQLVETSGGTLPYTYEWLKSSDGVTYSPIALANGSSYIFSTLPSTLIGTWSFKLVVTDSSPIPKTVTSNSASVIVNSALAAPEVTATPNTIIQTQSSILSSSFMTTGTSPYSFQWFLKGPSGDCITVGSNSSSYTFTGSTTIGIWTFLLQVTDSVGVSVNSSEVEVMVTSTPVFIINVTQSAHGIISPGTKSVILSGHQSFTILPDLGYHVDYVLVDGASVGAITSYTFNDVIEDHNISATFKIDQYVILASSGPYGSITPSGTVVINWNATQSFTITPDASYNIVDVMVDGNSVGSLTSYVFTQIVANHTINVTFAADTYTVTVSQSANGQIVPGTTNVNYNGSQSFTITANPGYYTVDVVVNGSSVGAVSSFTFTNIQNAYDISATFAPISSPTPSASPISSPTPSASPISSPTPSASPISSPTTVSATIDIDSGAKVDLAISGNVTAQQLLNITITPYSTTTTTVSFTIIGPSGTAGFGNMTIPKIAIPYGSNPVVYIDGQKAQDQGYSQNDNNYYVWYTTKFSTHQMAIQFALPPLPQGASSELVLFAIIPVAAIILVITVLTIKRYRRKTESPELEIKDSTSKSITTRISNNTISANKIPKVQSTPPLNEIKGSNSSPESNQNLTSKQKADNLKQKEDTAKCSYHFGYLRDHPKGKKTPEECYFCNRLIECHGETRVLS